jgi:hypothetical protein
MKKLMFLLFVIGIAVVDFIGFSSSRTIKMSEGNTLTIHSHSHHHDEVMEEKRVEPRKNKPMPSKALLMGHSMFFYNKDYSERIAIYFTVSCGEGAKSGSELVSSVINSFRKVIVGDGWFEIPPTEDSKYNPRGMSSVEVTQKGVDKAKIVVKSNGENIGVTIGTNDNTEKVAIEMYGLLFGVAA